MPTSTQTYLETDGKAVNVQLSYTVSKDDVAYVEQWLGIAQHSGGSGDYIALAIDERVYQFTVPAALAVAKGDTVYITTASVTGTHLPPDAAYSKTAAAGKIALFKATTAQDANNVVTGKLLN